MEHFAALCRRNADFLYVTAGVPHGYHWALEGQSEKFSEFISVICSQT